MKRKIQEFCADVSFLLHKVLPNLENAVVWLEPINTFFSLQFIAQVDNRFGQFPASLRVMAVFPLITDSAAGSQLPVYVALASLLLKLLSLICMLLTPSGNVLLRYIVICVMLLQSEILVLVDSSVWARSLSGSFDPLAFGLATLSFLVLVLGKLFQEIFMTNYTLISNDPMKKVRLPPEYLVRVPLHALLFYFYIERMPLWESFICWTLLVAVEISNIPRHVEFFVSLVPYTNERLAQLQIARLAILATYLVSSVLAEIDKLFLENWAVLYCVMVFLLFMVFNRQRASAKYELLCQEIDLLDRDAQTYTKLDTLHELIGDSSYDAQNLARSLYDVHRKNCRNVDCTCK